MNYLELWDCFDEVRENWNSNRQILESFLDVTKFRLKIEKSYCKKIEKLCGHNFFKLGKNTLVPAIEKFQSFYMSNLVNSKNFIIVLQTDIVQPLKDLIFSQEMKIKDKVEHGKRIESEKQRLAKACEQSKEKYWRACKETLVSVKHKPDHLVKEEEAYTGYIKQIEYLNRFSVTHADDMGKNLLVFQICEEERFKHFGDSLKKLFEIEEKCLKSTIIELESVPLVIFIIGCKYVQSNY